MTLTEFLLARIAEDEQIARAATDGVWSWVSDGYYDANAQSEFLTLETSEDVGEYGTVVIGSWSAYSDGDGLEVSMSDRLHIVGWQPSRVLAECEAKRRIVERAAHTAAIIDNESCCHEPAEIVAEVSSWVPGDRVGTDLTDPEWRCAGVHYLRYLLSPLAAIYADHPDYNPAWAE